MGFVYLIFNPRFTWMKGSIGILAHTVRQKLAQPGVSLRAHAASFRTRYWNSSREYWHMLWNNVVLLGIWALMCWAFGMARFFSIYLVSVHHLAAGIPNYCLVECHNEFQHLFGCVTRLKLCEVLGALDCILWDTRAQRIISLVEYQQRR